jgi:metallo-beta-lactamase class B
MTIGCALALALLLTTPAATLGQDTAELAKDPARFLETAQKVLKWNEPTEPTRIVGPLYFVGTKGLAAYLITTPQGHVLMNTAMPVSAPAIADSIRKLGFKPEDVKLLLAGHAHIDHVGGHAHIQQLSGARVAAIAEEVELIQSGGKLDFLYGAYPQFAFPRLMVEWVFHDGDMIKLGDVALSARLTPGHTKGSTTFVMKVVDEGKPYIVVFPNGTSINPGYRLVKDPSYPGIADDYRTTFRVLESLDPDIWLDAHTDVFDFEGKRERAKRDGVAAWVDPDGYRKWLAGVREKFETAVRTESSPSGPARQFR